MVAAAAALVTFAEFEQLPEIPGTRQELHNGEVVEVPPARHGHRLIQLNIQEALRASFRSDLCVHIEIGFKIRNLDYRIADVVVLPRVRWNSIPRAAYLENSPEMVIEVLSPSNTPARMGVTEQLCLNNGCLEFWVIDPKKQTVRISTPQGLLTTYKSGDQIPLLYGGTLPVNAIFA
ncbi:MAG: Uma2 family endonuclease [Acidobacteriia bacterium]|nr:Uma2 family endonuclease [Terriglobia bacterium]